MKYSLSVLKLEAFVILRVSLRQHVRIPHILALLPIGGPTILHLDAGWNASIPSYIVTMYPFAEDIIIV